MEETIPGKYAESHLDKMRREDQADNMKAYFRDLAANDRRRAVGLINDRDLCFCTLYMLQPEIIRSGIAKRLNRRNLGSLSLAYAIQKKNTRVIDSLIRNKKNETYELLRWILTTGSEEDGLNNSYDEIMELTGALLVRYYKDASILPLIADMIFKRNRAGLLIHNLVWVFFAARDPESLLILAGYLRSNEQEDYKLAYRLLDFIPCMKKSRDIKGEEIYQSVTQWLHENSQFLHPTGECLHLTANPIPFVVKRADK